MLGEGKRRKGKVRWYRAGKGIGWVSKMGTLNLNVTRGSGNIYYDEMSMKPIDPD